MSDLVVRTPHKHRDCSIRCVFQYDYRRASRSDVLEWLGEDAAHLIERENGELHCENCLHIKAVEDPDFDMNAAMEGVDE